MRKEFQFILVLALIVPAGALSLTFAQPSAPIGDERVFMVPPMPGGPRFGPDALELVGLTDQQRDQIETIRIAAFEASRSATLRIANADEQIRMYFESGGSDAAKVAPLVKAKMQALAVIELKRLAADAEITQLLSSEQKALLFQMRGRRLPSLPADGLRSRQ